MSTSQGQAIAAARALLRSLATGLSIHRLYPDNPASASFVSACERIAAVAEEAMAAGPVRIALRSGTFVVDDEPISDPGIDRLARACFDRRVELLGVEGVPSHDDLVTWYVLLSTDVDELEGAGGLTAAMHARGVTAIRTTTRTPMPSSGERVDPEQLGLTDWTVEVAPDPADDDTSASQLVIELEPGETGPELYARLAELFTSGAADRAAAGFFTKAAHVVGELPRAERAVFALRLFDRLTTEVFAEQYAGHLTDLALADLVADVAWFLGRDPAELAKEVAERAERHATLVALFEDGGAGLRSTSDIGDPDELPDTAPLLDGFPDSPEHERELAIRALVDVLVNSPRAPHLTAIVDNVVEQLRSCVRAGTEGPIVELLAGLDTAAAAGPDELAGQLALPRARTLQPALLAEVFTPRSPQGAPFDLSVLAPFETHAVPPLIAALLEARDAPTRSRLLDALAELGREHLGVVAATLDRQPPDLAVKLAPMVGRVTGLDVVSLLADLVPRASTPVLRECIDALVGQDQERAAPQIVRIVRRTTDADLRQHGIAVLAGLSGGLGRPHLEELARADVPAPLPRRLRRRALRSARKDRR